MYANHSKRHPRTTTRLRRGAATITAAAIGTTLLSMAAALAADDELPTYTVITALEAGLDAYDQADFAGAEQNLQVAAKSGNLRANEILGFMYLNGPDLYPGIARSRRRAISHFVTAAHAGSPVSAFLLCTFASDLPRRHEQRRDCATRVVATRLYRPVSDNADASIGVDKPR